MKVLIPLILWCAPAVAQVFPFPGIPQPAVFSGTCTPATGFLHCRALAIDPSQVGGSPLTNFPVWTPLMLGSARIQNANCYDVIFTSDSGGTTLIPWEQERGICNASTGAYGAWVGLASISSSVTTLFYVSYDNAAVSAAQNTGSIGPTRVWDTNYLAEYHLGPSLSLADSTSNGNSAINSGSAVSATGEIDGGASFNGTSQYLNTAQWSGFTSFTTAAWVKWTDVTPLYDYFISADNAVNFILTLYNRPKVNFFMNTSSGNFNNIVSGADGATTITNAVWYHIVGTYDGSSVKVYVNGTLDSANAANGTFAGVAPSRGSIGGDYAGHMCQCIMDEYSLSNVARSAAWITAQYNNQKPSPSFPTVGIEL